MVAPKTDTCSFPTSLPQSLTAMNKVCDTAVDHRSGLGKDWLAVRTGDMDVVCDKARRSEGGRPVGRSARLKRRRGDEMASPRSWAPKPSTPTMANRLGDAWGWARRGEPQLNRALARFHGSVPGELTSDGMTWGAWTWQEVKLASRAAFPRSIVRDALHGRPQRGKRPSAESFPGPRVLPVVVFGALGMPLRWHWQSLASDPSRPRGQCRPLLRMQLLWR